MGARMHLGMAGILGADDAGQGHRLEVYVSKELLRVEDGTLTFDIDCMASRP